MIQKLKYSFYFAVFLCVINAQLKIFAATGNIKAKETHQTMIGFGASIAWYEGTLTSHPLKYEIYDYIFNDLGLDILRLRNVYRNDADFGWDFAQIVSDMKDFSPDSPKVLISSWSPPADIKSNGTTDNGGTLAKVNGSYVYGAFAKYWVDAINAYRAIGINPDYITIQNEVDYSATWESCVFDPTETATNAGYNKALDSVYSAIQQLESPPKILGPEVLGIGNSEFQRYAKSFNRDHVYGYAYHLYGFDGNNPDLLKNSLAAIGNNYNDKPIFQTEFDQGGWLSTVWLIHNCIVYGNVSAYLWWELVWGTGSKPLVEMDNDTYTLTKYYWAFRQYSKYISNGWNRVTATDDTSSLKISAFVNPYGNKLTVVVINIGPATISMNFNIQDFSVDNGIVIRTTNTESGNIVSSNYNGTTPLDFPDSSITTISFDGNVVNNVQDQQRLRPAEFSLSQNYPNPFNPTATIEFSLPRTSEIRLVVINLLGQVVKEIASGNYAAGNYRVTLDASALAGGVYFCKLQAGSYSDVKKILLLK